MPKRAKLKIRRPASDTVELELHLPVAVVVTLELIRKQGMLGSTVGEVVEHILRQKMYEQATQENIARGAINRIAELKQ